MSHSGTFRLRSWVLPLLVGSVAVGSGFFGAIGAAEKPQDQRVGANIALGHKYTLWPQPNYAHCTDPEDGVQLTDDKSTTEYFWTQKGTVGWSGAPYAVVTLDLGRVEQIFWHTPKDRTKADAVRVKVLETLAALR